MSDEIQPEPDAQAARLITERHNIIARRAQSAKRLFLWSALIGIGFPFLSALLVLILLGKEHPLARPMLISSSLFGFFAVALIVWVRLRIVPKLNVEQIARVGGVHAIAALFATFENPLFPMEQGAAYEALTKLLPQMKANDAYLLAPAARRTMNVWLNDASSSSVSNSSFQALHIAALKALEQVGDASAIPYVEKLTQMKPRTPGQTKIKQAAIECLPMLLAHCGEVEAARTLLRASHSEDARPDTLLRPASQSAQTNPAELLRGSDLPETQE